MLLRSFLIALLGGGCVCTVGSAQEWTGTTARPLPSSRSVLELPPTSGNPRNSEGSFVTLKDGRILFVYSRFTGADFSDHAKAVLAARTSADEGETWSGDLVIATPGEEAAMNVMSVSLLRLGNGDLGLFYCLRHSWHDLRMLLRRSSDEGKSWSEPVLCMQGADYHVVNNDRVLRLSSGRLLIPTALHRKLKEEDAPSSRDWRAQATFFLSDDDGKSWRQSLTYCVLPSPHTRSGLQEPGVVELPNGVLWGYARTDMGRQYEFFSHDGGETWSTPQPSRFTSPVSPLSIKRVPGTDRYLAVWNPIPFYQTRPLESPGGDRTPLVGAVGTGTRDAEWSTTFLVDRNDQENEGYSYTALHFTSDSVLLAYCAGGKSDSHRLSRLRIRKITLADLPTPASRQR